MNNLIADTAFHEFLLKVLCLLILIHFSTEGTRDRVRQSGCQALPEDTGLLHATRAPELLHVPAVVADTTLSLHAGFAFSTSDSSPPGS